MARLWTSGAELNDLTAEGLTLGSGAVTFDTTEKRSGARGFKFDSGAGNAAQWAYLPFTGAVGTTYYARTYLKLSAFPTSNVFVVEFEDGAGTNLVRARVSTTGRLVLYAGDGTTVLVTGPFLDAGTWYRVEVKLTIATGSTDETELFVGDTSWGASTGLALSDSAPGRLSFGWTAAPGANTVIAFDDLALNDSSGSDQNSFPGLGAVVALNPTADSAVGTGWTVGDGSGPVSTNLFGGVDNTPPVGVADSTATPNQIRNAVSNNNTDYDATTQTYTAVGVPANALIKVSQVVAVVGCTTSGTTNATLVGVSNPVIAGLQSSFYAGANAGTHPTGWIRREGLVSYDPAVTLGTAPVIRIGKRTATTRVGLCSLLVLQVEYRDATVITAPAAAGTGAGIAPTGIVRPVPTAGNATTSAVAPSGIVRPVPTAALGSGTAPSPTGIVRPVPSAGGATSAGIAPTVVATIAGATGYGLGVGVAPVGIITATPAVGAAVGGVVAPTGVVLAVPSAGASTGTGVAPVVWTTIGVAVAYADAATGTPTGVVIVVAPVGGATGSAPAPTLLDQPLYVAVPAAFGEGVAIAPNVSVVALPSAAPTDGTASPPVGYVLAPSGVASALGASSPPALMVTALPPPALSLGSAPTPVGIVVMPSSVADALGSASAPDILIVVVAPSGGAIGMAAVPTTTGGVFVLVYPPSWVVWDNGARPRAVWIDEQARAVWTDGQPHASAWEEGI